MDWYKANSSKLLLHSGVHRKEKLPWWSRRVTDYVLMRKHKLPR